MSNEDLQATLAALEAVRLDIGDSPEKARAFLIEHGFNTEDGELTEHYR